MTAYRKSLPRPTPETQAYWDGLRQRRLILQRCTVCHRAYFYPRPFCPQLDCHSRQVESFQASGRGTVYSYVINTRPAPGFEDDVPYFIAVVELEEGPRLMTTLIDVPGDDVLAKAAHVKVGDPVEIVFERATDAITLPKFRLVATSEV
jgi:uncharacterized OB-fold protein